MPPKEKYTDPKLRDKVKEEIHQSDKGGKPGQWSARKAQLMASEYKKRGGGYNQSKEEGQDESQKHLDKWTKEDWQTKEGSGTAKKSDGSRKRYLPKEAWEKLSDDEKEQTDAKKVKESKKGKQFVGNTGRAKEEGRNARNDEGDGEDNESMSDRKADGESDEGSDKEDTEGDNEQEDKTRKASSQGKGKQKAGAKRTANQKNGPNKKRETQQVGDKEAKQEEPHEQDDEYVESDAEDEEEEEEEEKEEGEGEGDADEGKEKDE